MTLTSEAYLRITDDNDDVGLFQFESFEPTATLDKRFLIGGNRGEIIGEIADFVPVFGGPLPVAPESVEIRRDPEEPSRVELTIEMLRFENFGVLDGGDRVPDL